MSYLSWRGKVSLRKNCRTNSIVMSEWGLYLESCRPRPGSPKWRGRRHDDDRSNALRSDTLSSWYSLRILSRAGGLRSAPLSDRSCRCSETPWSLDLRQSGLRVLCLQQSQGLQSCRNQPADQEVSATFQSAARQLEPPFQVARRGACRKNTLRRCDGQRA